MNDKKPETESGDMCSAWLGDPIAQFTLKIVNRDDGIKTTTFQQILPQKQPPQITTSRMTPSQTNEVLSALGWVESEQPL